MSAFGIYEKNEVVDAIKLLAQYERQNGAHPRRIVESIMEAVTYGIDSALYDIRFEKVDGDA